MVIGEYCREEIIIRIAASTKGFSFEMLKHGTDEDLVTLYNMIFGDHGYLTKNENKFVLDSVPA